MVLLVVVFGVFVFVNVFRVCGGFFDGFVNRVISFVFVFVFRVLGFGIKD